MCSYVHRLVEQTLDSCQLKRVRSASVKVDLRWLCTHLQRWGLMGRDFNLQELVVIAIFAKQVGRGGCWQACGSAATRPCVWWLRCGATCAVVCDSSWVQGL